jgi:hypothetical protein
MMGVLILLSLLISVLGSELAWREQTPAPGRVNEFIARLTRTTVGRGLFEIARFLYYLGLPYAAAFVGFADLRALGLVSLDWVVGVRWAILLAVGGWLVLLAVWLPYIRATESAPSLVAEWPRRPVEVLYMQAHWAFYRAGAIMLLDNTYWGAFAGLALVALEAFADPRVRRDLGQIGQVEYPLWSGGLAAISAVSFVLTQNTWLTALIHYVLEFTVPHGALHPVIARDKIRQLARTSDE